MIEYRSFLNTDPPALIEIWQKQTPSRSTSQVLSRKSLDQMVLSKPYFDPAGLIIALADGVPIGFVHVGFGPNEELSDIDHSIGILGQLRVVESEQSKEVANGLLGLAVEYLKGKGATTCFAGSRFPHSPFYTGLYGGSRIPGVPAEDIETAAFLKEYGFTTGQRILVKQLDLQGYRAPVSRSQMSVRRQYQVAAIVDPLIPNWWDSCTFGWSEIFGFRVVRRSDQAVCGNVMFWDIQPLSAQWGKSTMGQIDLEIDEDLRGQGLATFLVGESLRHLSQQGVACIEAQFKETDEPAISVARRIGFQEVSEGHEMELSLV